MLILLIVIIDQLDRNLCIRIRIKIIFLVPQLLKMVLLSIVLTVYQIH